MHTITHNENNTATIGTTSRNSLPVNYVIESKICDIYSVSKPDEYQYEIEHIYGMRIIDGPNGTLGKYLKVDSHGIMWEIKVISQGQFNTENGIPSNFLSYEGALRFQKELINRIIQGYEEDIFQIDTLILKEKEKRLTGV